MTKDITDMTRDQAVERARDLIPVLRERAAKTENLRRLPDETIADFSDSGLMRLAQPRRWGGPELPFSAHLDVVAELGRGCGSAAWTFSIFASHFWQMGTFSEQAQQDVWGSNPEALLCTSTVGGPPPERVPGGVHIAEGRWNFLSGVHHADWIAVNAPLPRPEQGMPDLQFLLVPKGEFQIVDDWYTTSLAGTGSCSVVLQDVFVPEHRMLSFMSLIEGTAPGAQVNPAPMFRVPLMAGWPIYLSAPAVGIARGAIDAFTEKLANRAHAYTRQPLKSHPLMQSRLGEATARVDAAWSIMARAVDEATSAVEQDRPVDNELRARNRRDFAFAVGLCVEAVETLFLASGASSLSETSAIQRCWRDVHGVAQHAMLNLDQNLVAWGRHALGIPGEF